MRKANKLKRACALGLAAFLALGSISVNAQEVETSTVESQSQQNYQPATQPSTEQETTVSPTTEAIESTAQSQADQEETASQPESTTDIADEGESDDNTDVESLDNSESCSLESSSSEGSSSDIDVDMDDIEPIALYSDYADNGNYNFANVVVCAYFDGANAADDKAYFESADTRNELLRIYNGSQGLSVSNYLKTISEGNLLIKNIFPQDNGSGIDAYCIKSATLEQANTGNVDDKIIEEIMNAIPALQNVTIDYDNNGVIDNLTVILRGGKGIESSQGVTKTMYAHKADYSGAGTTWWSGKTISCFNMLNTYRLMESIVSEESGVVCHEFLHSLGFPDLYTNTGVETVHTWDIMASVSHRLSYPLAYMRKEVGHWLSDSEIPTITESAEGLRLDSQTTAGGVKAYILKSPLDQNQFFVIEFRQKPAQSYTDYDSLDYYIGGSGLIVYRIDTRVSNLSNQNGQGYGVYVLRPQVGQNGYSDNERQCINNAYLSAESGRTTMGFSDLNKKMTDGAIAYADGSNSGIVISNVSSSAGNSMTFDVTIPSEEDYDSWTNTQFNDSESAENYNKNVCLTSIGSHAYMATYSANDNSKIQLWSMENGVWTEAAAPILISYISSMKLVVNAGELFIAYTDGGKTYVKKLSSGSWINQAEFDSGNYFDIASINNNIYLSYLNMSEGINSYANLATIENGSLKVLAAKYVEGFFGENKVADINNNVYISLRDGNNNITLYRYDGNGCIKVKDIEPGNSYDMVSDGNKLYILRGLNQSNTLEVYNGNTIESIAAPVTLNCTNLKLVMSQGTLYALFVPGTGENVQVYRYNEANKTFVEEGIGIDGEASIIDLVSIGNKLYAAYVKSSTRQIIIKVKETVNGWETAEFYGHSLSLDGDIGVIFYMKVPDYILEDTASYMKFTLSDGTKQSMKLADAKERTINGVKYYGFKCRVAAKDMKVSITAQMFKSDDTTELSEQETYSVETYLNTVETYTDASYNKLKSLAASMKTYGIHAKAYFNNDIEAQSEEMTSVTVNNVIGAKATATNELPEGLSYVGSLLDANSSTAIKHFYKVSSGHNITEYTFMIGNQTVQPASYNDMYYVEISDIAAKDLANMNKLVINNNYGYDYSALSYVYSVLNSNTNQGLVNFCKALYLYNQKAIAYFSN